MSEIPKPTFDPRISMGNVIQIFLIIGAVSVGWFNLDKRVVILEENRATQQIRDKHQDFLIQQQSQQTENAVNEIKASILRMETKIDDLRERR